MAFVGWEGDSRAGQIEVLRPESSFQRFEGAKVFASDRYPKEQFQPATPYQTAPGRRRTAFSNYIRPSNIKETIRCSPGNTNPTVRLTAGLQTFQRVLSLKHAYFRGVNILDPSFGLTIEEKRLLCEGSGPSFSKINGHLDVSHSLPLLSGRFRFVESLSEGGSAKVFRAQDTLHPSKRLVVIKAMHRHYFEVGHQEQQVLRFLNWLDPVDSCHIVRLVCGFQFQGHSCLVLECLQRSLLDHMCALEASQGNAWNVTRLLEVRRIAFQLATALATIHSAGIIHGDLKPENVLCSGDGAAGGSPSQLGAVSIKLADFGNSFTMDQAPEMCKEFNVQTLAYRAPEVLLGVCMDPSIDMWSFGCMIAELALGRLLFACESPSQLLSQMVSVLGAMPPSNLFGDGKFYRKLHDEALLPQVRVVDANGFNVSAHSRVGAFQDNFCVPGRSEVGDSLLRLDPLLADLVGNLLQYDPRCRPSAAETLKHPFFSGEGSYSSTSSPSSSLLYPSSSSSSGRLIKVQPAAGTATSSFPLSNLNGEIQLPQAANDQQQRLLQSQQDHALALQHFLAAQQQQRQLEQHNLRMFQAQQQQQQQLQQAVGHEHQHITYLQHQLQAALNQQQQQQPWAMPSSNEFLVPTAHTSDGSRALGPGGTACFPPSCSTSRNLLLDQQSAANHFLLLDPSKEASPDASYPNNQSLAWTPATPCREAELRRGIRPVMFRDGSLLSSAGSSGYLLPYPCAGQQDSSHQVAGSMAYPYGDTSVNHGRQFFLPDGSTVEVVNVPVVPSNQQLQQQVPFISNCVLPDGMRMGMVNGRLPGGVQQLQQQYSAVPSTLPLVLPASHSTSSTADSQPGLRYGGLDGVSFGGQDVGHELGANLQDPGYGYTSHMAPQHNTLAGRSGSSFAGGSRFLADPEVYKHLLMNLAIA